MQKLNSGNTKTLALTDYTQALCQTIHTYTHTYTRKQSRNTPANNLEHIDQCVILTVFGKPLPLATFSEMTKHDFGEVFI